VVSREMYGRHVCILQMLWVLSSFLRSERETPLLVDFVARPPHVFLLLADVAALPEATALDVQNLSLVVTTFRGCEFIVEWKVWMGEPVIDLAWPPLIV
jgi:hypothetical protein